MRKIILASSSPRRKALLVQIGLPFTVEVSDYEEIMDDISDPHELAQRLSFGKAESVARKHSDEIIIGSDTFIVFNDKKLGKPHDVITAKKMLQMISGNKHTVVTGLTVIDTLNKRTITTSVEANVYMKKMSEEEIDRYVATGEPLDKAGAYGIQEKGGVFVEKIEGDYFTIVGLPIPRLIDILKEFSIILWES